ncbi:MAP kinase [Aureococcus anophagefferens]|nr:MAP kinase [Aureococcus anophagefferens]
MALLPPDSTHQFTVSNTVFEVPKRYSLIRSVGNGSYGVVISAVDSDTKCKVAIKKIRRRRRRAKRISGQQRVIQRRFKASVRARAFRRATLRARER